MGKSKFKAWPRDVSKTKVIRAKNKLNRAKQMKICVRVIPRDARVFPQDMGDTLGQIGLLNGKIRLH